MNFQLCHVTKSFPQCLQTPAEKEVVLRIACFLISVWDLVQVWGTQAYGCFGVSLTVTALRDLLPSKWAMLKEGQFSAWLCVSGDITSNRGISVM